jgi:hypothetical protein
MQQGSMFFCNKFCDWCQEIFLTIISSKSRRDLETFLAKLVFMIRSVDYSAFCLEAACI